MGACADCTKDQGVPPPQLNKNKPADRESYPDKSGEIQVPDSTQNN